MPDAMPAERRWRVYIAVSVDGYVADADGGVGWLEAFHEEGQDFGYHAFLASVSTIVMGRRTYEQVRGFGDWPYGEKTTLVQTSRPAESFDDVPAGVSFFHDTPAALIEHVNATTPPGDVWLLGGPASIDGFWRIGAIDELMLYIMPIALGTGLPLWSAGGTVPANLELVGATPMGQVVELRYAPIASNERRANERRANEREAH